jgi:hypothetical protein
MRSIEENLTKTLRAEVQYFSSTNEQPAGRMTSGSQTMLKKEKLRTD